MLDAVQVPLGSSGVWVAQSVVGGRRCTRFCHRFRRHWNQRLRGGPVDQQRAELAVADAHMPRRTALTVHYKHASSTS
jgi:hypothetical protein